MKYVVIGVVILAAVFASLNKPTIDNKEDIEAAKRRYEERCRQLLLEQEDRDINLDKEE